ncbi:MAG: hypothetical protein LJU34_00815 [Oscillospiraceae bacterium]|nr:hypothetical protein [Oscillospiraceae bacterium]
MFRRYNQSAAPLRHTAPYTLLAVLGGIALALAVFCGGLSISSARYDVAVGMSIAMKKAAVVLAGTAIALLVIAAVLYKLTPAEVHIQNQVKRALYHPSHGNPLRLRTGELLPRVHCKKVGDGLYDLTISAQQGSTVETLADAASAISSALNRRYEHYAIVQTDADTAFNSVTFRMDDVKIDRSLTVADVNDLLPESVTKLRVDNITTIDLTTSGSMLFAGKTRSGKTTGVISVLLQVLLMGPDQYNSSVVVVDPKQAELSRLPHTITLDEDREVRNILEALKHFTADIKYRQQILNDLSEERGDAIKWWDAGFHPSFLFIDEYIAARTIFPAKAGKDDDYCLNTFDGLVKRIITMGASAGCFCIISIAEASVQEGGLPAMLRSAMSTRVLFRPTLPEARLIWDSEKLEDFSISRVYGPGDAWFSSTDGIHDAVSFVHFPRMEFPEYRELGRLLREYYDVSARDCCSS